MTVKLLKASILSMTAIFNYLIIKLKMKNNCQSKISIFNLGIMAIIFLLPNLSVLYAQSNDGTLGTGPTVGNSVCPEGCMVPCPWNCNPGAVIEPSISGDCATAMDRYLSRSADVGSLQKILFNNDGGNTECISPYGSNDQTNYCPCKYAELIKSLIDLDVQFVQRAFAGAAGEEHRFFPGEDYFKVGSQIVNDINKAYDCAGKPRPIIQATFDNSDHNNFAIMTGPGQHIPGWIINKYFEYFPADLPVEATLIPSWYPGGTSSIVTNKDYYYKKGDDGQFVMENGKLVPRTDLRFDADRIYDAEYINDQVMAINKIEMRMWCLYVTLTEINMGYKSISMGIYYDYAKPTPDGKDPGYVLLKQLTDAIRDYAISKGSFVLLCGETPMASNAGGGQSAHYVDSDGELHFIFDFDSRAMRPREVVLVNGVDQGQSPSGDGDNCDQPIDPNFLAALSDPDCPCHDYEMMAVVDPCTINSFGESLGGISPLCGTYVTQQPYTVHFDGFSKIDSNQPSGGPSSLTYGYNDHQWFSMLPPACRIWWYNYFFCDRRQYHDGNGFLVIPGIIQMENFIKMPIPRTEYQRQLICDQPDFMDSLKGNALYVHENEPDLLITEECLAPRIKNVCQNEWSPKYQFLVWQKCYTITTSFKDCTSTYNLKITEPNGKSHIIKLNEPYKFCPNIDGFYVLELIEDNFGIKPVSANGTRSYSITRFFNSECCQRLNKAFGPLAVTQRCVKQTTTKRVYEFSIESESTNSLSNLRPNNSIYQIRDITQITPQKMSGLIDVRNSDISDMEFLVDVRLNDNASDLDPEDMETFYVREGLINCENEGQLFRSEKSDQKNEASPTLFWVFPNPTKAMLSVQYEAAIPESVNVTIFNSLMQVVSSKQFESVAGSNLWDINVEYLPQGNYTVLLGSASSIQRRIFVKMD
jgi:hypothetical protein